MSEKSLKDLTAEYRQHNDQVERHQRIQRTSGEFSLPALTKALESWRAKQQMPAKKK